MYAALLDKLTLGVPSWHRNLTLVPILLKDGPLRTIEAQSLDEALAHGTIRVTEVSAEGHVPELRVMNSGKTPVLILDGEELVGAKQNRIVNVTILVPPQSEIIIPVSCIEAGRWSYLRPSFTAAGRVLNQAIRYCKADAVTRSLKKRANRFADQHAVWDGVGQALFALGAASPTRALSDAYDSRVNAINDYLAAFKLLPGRLASSTGLLECSSDSISSVPRLPLRVPFPNSFADRRYRLWQASTGMRALRSTIANFCAQYSMPPPIASRQSALARSCASTPRR
jgi:hypothetical protein